MKAKRKYWFAGIPEACQVLANHPGWIAGLIGRRFKVVRQWPDLLGETMNGRPALAPWKEGIEGLVVSLVFRNRNGWRVTIENEQMPASWAIDEVWVEVPLQHFLRCCEPLDDEAPIWLPTEAANDD